jgi:glycosyltransferase involved in cell wall biosynthesis
MNIVGNLSMVDSARSWGMVLTNFALALKALGHEVRCVSENGQVNIDPRIRPLLVDDIDPREAVFTYCSAPALLKIIPRPVYCMTAYESSILPKGWKEAYNTPGITVIVNSTQQQDMMKANGVNAVIVPLGIDPETYRPDGDKLDLGGKFKFLSIGIPHFRKGFDLLLRAFADEFKPDEPVALVIKTDKLTKLNYWEINIVDEIRKAQAGRKTAEIMLITGDRADLGSLYRASQCYVSASRGEGFGLCLLEARACGLPIIETECMKIPAPAAAQYHTFSPNATIMEPLPNMLKHNLRLAFEGKYDKKNKGSINGYDIKDWTWTAAARKLLKVMGVKDEETELREWVEKQNKGD